MRVIELIPDGNNIKVTLDNRNYYIEKMLNWYLIDSVTI